MERRSTPALVAGSGAANLPDALQLVANCGTVFAVGADWSWDAVDPQIAPTPDATQRGVCT